MVDTTVLSSASLYTYRISKECFRFISSNDNSVCLGNLFQFAPLPYLILLRYIPPSTKRSLSLFRGGLLAHRQANPVLSRNHYTKINPMGPDSLCQYVTDLSISHPWQLYKGPIGSLSMMWTAMYRGGWLGARRFTAGQHFPALTTFTVIHISLHSASETSIPECSWW